MNLEQLVFFNKEGYQINAELDPNGYWKSKLFFDKNSTDTYKTLGIYTFEKTLASNNTFQAFVDKFQAFNTDGLETWPANQIGSIEILDIQKTNNSPLFRTKWIYIQTDARFIPGQWCQFSGLNGYLSTDFNDAIAGQIQSFQILDVQADRIMVRTQSANNIPLPTFVPASSKKITFLNTIQWHTSVLPTWQESSGMTKIYSGKKLQTIGTDIETIYTSIGPSIPKTKIRYQWLPTALTWTPTQGDQLRLKINLFTDRFLINTGVTQFSPLGFINDIQIGYIPQILKIGDQIIAEPKTVALFAPNQATFTVTAIDRPNGRITVSPAPILQTVDCYLYLASNQFVIDQPVVLDNNNILSIPVSYWSLVTKWLQTLNGYDILAKYNTANDSLELEHLYAETYFTATLEAITSTGQSIIGPTAPTSTTTLQCYPYHVSEDTELSQTVDISTLYNRKFVFNTIDNAGIRILINGQLYDADFDTNVPNTVLDWISLWQTDLANLGINVIATTTVSPNDTIQIQPDFPNRPITIDQQMGDQSVWWIPYKSYQFIDIRSQLLITINGTNYRTLFSVSDAVTVSNWVSQWQAELELLGIYVALVAPATLEFRIRQPERRLQIQYNIGYLPKNGDTSVIEIDLATNNKFQLIAGNELKTVTGTYNMLQLYAVGQKITLSGLAKLPQNTSYNIIGLSSDTLSLSYQGSFWQEGLPLFNILVESEQFLQQPKQGISTQNQQAKLVWSWKDTQIDDMFMYDFSGLQLEPIYPGFPQYNGPLPLCGPNGEIELKLNRQKNDDSRPEFISDPTKQQTVFDKIENRLQFTDQADNVLIEPTPLQIFLGYQSKIGSVSKARLYCEMVENLQWSLTTASNLVDDVWQWNETDKSVQILSPTASFDWQLVGFRAGQRIKVNSIDINADGRKLVTSLNQGKILTIKTVGINKITFVEDIISETSVKTIPKTTAPFYDSFGNQLTEQRRLSITLEVVPIVIAYFDIFGESEEEDWRHQINLNNRNLNILKLQDFFIFKQVDINEQGIDWVFMNRKRKQLVEIYGQIFNNISSYKAIIEAINFFGYNDLTFTEYFQNVNPDSRKYGQLFNMEILEIFNKLQPNWQNYSNLAVENLRNKGYRKTNLFSLNYFITDRDGHFVNAYSLEEVQIKLNGLRRWLKENLVPIGAEIVDINGKWIQPVDWKIKHETYQTKRFNVEEYSTPIDFITDGYILPIVPNGTQYGISVKPFSAGPVKWFDIIVKTFYLDSWLKNSIYYVGDIIYWKGRVWIANTNVAVEEEPGISSVWTLHSFDLLPCNQILRDIRWNTNPFSFTINSTVDPHFQVEINWHSEYACTLTRKKTYSVIPDFFKDLI